MSGAGDMFAVAMEVFATEPCHPFAEPGGEYRFAGETGEVA